MNPRCGLPTHNTPAQSSPLCNSRCVSTVNIVTVTVSDNSQTIHLQHTMSCTLCSFRSSPSSSRCWAFGTTTSTVRTRLRFCPTTRYLPFPMHDIVFLHVDQAFLPSLSTCTGSRRTSNKATWSRTASRSHAAARGSTTRPDRLYGENLALTASTRSTSSSTKVRIEEKITYRTCTLYINILISSTYFVKLWVIFAFQELV